MTGKDIWYFNQYERSSWQENSMNQERKVTDAQTKSRRHDRQRQ